MSQGQPTNLDRLRASSDISKVFAEGQRVRVREAQILWLTRRGHVSRFAVCVGRRHGNAIRRNRLKRVLRSLIREVQDKIPPGIDFAILPSTGKFSVSVPALRQSFEELLDKLSRSVAEGTGSGP